MGNSAVAVTSVETAFQGHFRLDVYRLRIRQFDGSWSGEFARELFVSGPAVVVILYDPEADAVVLVEQFRLGPYASDEPCWMLEYVAGKIEAGETTDAVAHRETAEEANCEIQRLERITGYFVSPGSGDEYIHLYVGQVDSSHAGGVFGLAEENEDIRVRVMRADEVIALADTGQLPNMNTLLGTLWLARHRDGLRRRWLAE